MKLTKRDFEILDSLSRKVRLFTLEQIAGHWWKHCSKPKQAAKRSLGRLVERGLVKRFRVLAHPLPELRQAIAYWEPSMPRPDPNQVAWQLQKRWVEPPTYQLSFIASLKGKNLFGGNTSSSLTRPIQATHDLGMAQVYLLFLNSRREEARMWLGEDVQTPGDRSKNPDAQLFDESGNAVRVVEFGGCYTAKRVSSFHHYCVGRAIPYEIW